jgi:Ion channel
LNQATLVRRRFYRALIDALRVVWPVFSALLGLMIGLGAVVAYVESWPLTDGVYFAFVTGLTVGYGDLVPHRGLSRILAIAIGFSGILLTALFAAVSVRALQDVVLENRQSRPEEEQSQ